MDKIKMYMYYFIIGIVSLVALVFLPMIGSEIGLAWSIPNTIVGWIVWIATKLIVATINVLIFYSFMQQAKLNVKNNENYKEAQEILGKVKVKNYIPRSPQKWNAEQYGKKGITLFATTALATIALTQAVLSFDWIAMLSFLFTIIMGLIFGILQMKRAEEYWTQEFWKYAKMIEDKDEKEKSKTEVEKSMEMAQKECSQQGNANMGDNSRSDILESSDSNSASSSDNKSMVLDSNNSNNNILGGTIHSSSSVTTGTCSSIKKNKSKMQRTQAEEKGDE